jgi:hypothetical protein
MIPNDPWNQLITRQYFLCSQEMKQKKKNQNNRRCFSQQIEILGDKPFMTVVHSFSSVLIIKIKLIASPHQRGRIKSHCSAVLYHRPHTTHSTGPLLCGAVGVTDGWWRHHINPHRPRVLHLCHLIPSQRENVCGWVNRLVFQKNHGCATGAWFSFSESLNCKFTSFQTGCHLSLKIRKL